MNWWPSLVQVGICVFLVVAFVLDPYLSPDPESVADDAPVPVEVLGLSLIHI